MPDDELDDMLADFETLRKNFLAFWERWPRWGKFDVTNFSKEQVRRLDDAVDRFAETLAECMDDTRPR